MEIPNNILFQFIKLCLASGILTVFSFFSFAVLFHFGNPELEIFVTYFKNDMLREWASRYLLGCSQLFKLMGFLFLAAALSTVGYITATLAKSFLDKAVDLVKSNIVT